MSDLNWKGFPSAVALSQCSRIVMYPGCMKLLGVVDGGSSNIQASASFFGEDNDGAGRRQEHAAESVDGSPGGGGVRRRHIRRSSF